MAPSKNSSLKTQPAQNGGGKYAGMKRSTARERASFSACGEVALDAIDMVIDQGDAIILSRTSDGGAVAVTIIAGDERSKEYAASQAELDEIVDFLKRQ